MRDVLVIYHPQIIGFIQFLTLPFCVFIISLSHVYVWGRMLGFVESYRVKNFIALITIWGAYMVFFFTVDDREFLDKVWYMLLYVSISILMYVFLGFKLYDIVEEFIDRKLSLKNKKR